MEREDGIRGVYRLSGRRCGRLDECGRRPRCTPHYTRVSNWEVYTLTCRVRSLHDPEGPRKRKSSQEVMLEPV